MASDQRKAKRARMQQQIESNPGCRKMRLQNVMHIKSTSTRALQDIMRGLVDDVPTRRELTDIGQARFSSIFAVLELPLKTGGTFSWEFCNPSMLVAMMVAESPALQECFASALRRKPCSVESPWRLLVGFDEFIPGNKLQVQPSRKCMNLSFTFLELAEGGALHHDVFWFTPVAVRSTKIKAVVGGWSRMLRDFLLFALRSPSGFEVAGAPLQIHEGHALIFARVAIILSDGDGLRMALEWMGQGCLKPCWRHYNVMRKESERAPHLPSRYCEISCCDSSRFRTWSNDEFETAVDVILEARRQFEGGARVDVKIIEQAYGFHPTKEGLLANRTLRTCFKFQDVMRYDWVHTFLQDGSLTTDAWLLIQACTNHGLASNATILEFIQEEWVTPMHRRHRGRPLSRIFNEWGEKANTAKDKLACSASELLNLYGLLRHFFECRVVHDARIAQELLSYQLCCKAVDVIILAKRGSISMAEAGSRLRTALEAHMAQHIRAYGLDKIRPKSHWSFDIADFLERDEFLFDCFIIERLHLRVKAVAENIKNLHTSERSVMSGIVNDQVRRLRVDSLSSGLLGRTAKLLGFPDVLLADHLDLQGFCVAVDDYVFYGNVGFGQVLACCIEGDMFFVIAKPMRKVSDLSSTSSRWTNLGAERAVWRATVLSECVAWKHVTARDVIALRL